VLKSFYYVYNANYTCNHMYNYQKEIIIYDINFIYINNKKLIILCTYKIDIKNEKTRNAALILYKISNLVSVLPLT